LLSFLSNKIHDKICLYIIYISSNCKKIEKNKVFYTHAIKACGGVKIQFHSLSISSAAGSKWSAARLGRFTPRETIPSTRSVGNFVDHRVGLGVTKRNYSLALSVIRTPDCPARSLVTIPAAFSQILPILRNKGGKGR
jgi:hypothetical protein